MKITLILASTVALFAAAPVVADDTGHKNFTDLTIPTFPEPTDSQADYVDMQQLNGRFCPDHPFRPGWVMVQPRGHQWKTGLLQDYYYLQRTRAVVAIVITLLVGLAPLAILCTMFSWSKDYFQRWLSAAIAFAFYPVVIAAVFATVLGLLGAVLDLVGDPEEITSIGQVTPVLGVLCLSVLLAGMVPMIVSTITGNISLQDMVTTGLGRTSSRLAGTAGRKAYQQTRKAASNVASDTAAYMKNPIANTREQGASRAAQINRAAERVQRLRRK